MSLEVRLFASVDTGGIEKEIITLFDANITHNLIGMADEAGIYESLWNPKAEIAAELIIHLENGLKKLKNDPAKFSEYNASNGWGVYEDFVPFVENYLNACKAHPEANVSVSV